MSEVRGVGREALIYVLATSGQALAALAAFYLFSRLLAPGEYGYYFVVLAAAEMTNGIAVGWINVTLVRQHPATTATERPLLLGNLAITFLLTAAVLALLALLASLALAAFGADASLPWLVLTLVLPMGALSMSQWLFRAQRRPVFFLGTLLIVAVVRLLLGWALLSYVANTGRTLVLVQTCAVLLTFIWAATQVREPVRFLRGSVSWTAIKPVLGYGLPLALVNTGTALMNTAGRLILGLLAGAGAVGIFAPANQLSRQLIEMGVRPLTMAFVPVSYRIFERDGEHAARRALHHTAALLVTIATGMGLTLFLLRHAIVDALLDPAYASAADLIGYLAPALALSMLHPLLIKSFEFARQTGALSWYTLLAGVLNVALNFALIPWLGAAGAALAALLAYGAYCGVTYLGAQRHFRWGFPWLQPLAVAIPIGVLLTLNQAVPSPRGVLPTVAYVLGYIALYALTALLCLRLGPRPWREQLAFLRTLFRAPQAGSAPAGAGTDQPSQQV